MEKKIVRYTQKELNKMEGSTYWATLISKIRNAKKNRTKGNRN